MQSHFVKLSTNAPFLIPLKSAFNGMGLKECSSVFKKWEGKQFKTYFLSGKPEKTFSHSPINMNINWDGYYIYP